MYVCCVFLCTCIVCVYTCVCMWVYDMYVCVCVQVIYVCFVSLYLYVAVSMFLGVHDCVCCMCVCICMSDLYLRYDLCWSKLCFINRVAKQIWFWGDNFGQLLLCGIFSEQRVECTGVSYSKLLYTEVEIESRILSQNITFDSQFLCKFSTRERLISQLNKQRSG